MSPIVSSTKPVLNGGGVGDGGSSVSTRLLHSKEFTRSVKLHQTLHRLTKRDTIFKVTSNQGHSTEKNTCLPKLLIFSLNLTQLRMQFGYVFRRMCPLCGKQSTKMHNQLMMARTEY